MFPFGQEEGELEDKDSFLYDIVDFQHFLQELPTEMTIEQLMGEMLEFTLDDSTMSQRKIVATMEGYDKVRALLEDEQEKATYCKQNFFPREFVIGLLNNVLKSNGSNVQFLHQKSLY